MTVILRYDFPFRISNTTRIKTGIESWARSSEISETTAAVSMVEIRREYHRGSLYLTLPMLESELSDSSVDILTRTLSDSIGITIYSPAFVDDILAC